MYGSRSLGNPKLTNAGAEQPFLLAEQQGFLTEDFPGSIGYRPVLAFGEGDAVGNCIESIQYTINGCSISHQNWHLFKRSMDRCWIPSQVMQKIYYQAGGAWNAYDVKCLSGQSSVLTYPSPAYMQNSNEPIRTNYNAVGAIGALAAPGGAGGGRLNLAGGAIMNFTTKTYADLYGVQGGNVLG